jgi:UDP:flavonoid glycosyltransferase YjiC (YdhE family)
MARIAFAWELGSDLGHAMACASLAQALRARGHTCAYIFRDLAAAAHLPEAAGLDLLQAPRCRHAGDTATLPASFTEILLGNGYADPGELAAIVGAWRSLLVRWRADLVVADFAPGALLAARSLAMRRVAYGNGFTIAPRADPMPAFRFDEPVAPARLVEADARALRSINAALARFGTAPLTRLADFLATDEDFLCTFPQLDHYGTRPASGYWGPRLRTEQGLDVEWPEGPGQRVLLYLRTAFPHLDALIDHLAAGPHRVIAFLPGSSEAQRKRLAGGRRVVLERPARLDRLLRHCDLVVSHGGEIATGSLALGVPQLTFPNHYEQYITAVRFEQLGAGRQLPATASARDVLATLEAVLGNARFALAARSFAQKHAGFTPSEQRRRIVLRIEEILAGPILSPTTNPGSPG